MKVLLCFLSICFTVFLMMHEFDAIHEGEWKMFVFLSKLKERNQYLIFLYSHIFICGILIYNLWCTYNFTNIPLIFCMNLFGVFHLLIHLVARKWKTNVFKSVTSFLFIGISGAISVISIGILLYIKIS